MTYIFSSTLTWEANNYAKILSVYNFYIFTILLAVSDNYADPLVGKNKGRNKEERQPDQFQLSTGTEYSNSFLKVADLVDFVVM